MINVCTGCLRLNSLGQKKCLHCRDTCQAMESQDYGRFMLRSHGKKGQKEEQAENEDSEDNISEYPDLKVFEDCANLNNPWELYLLRP